MTVRGWEGDWGLEELEREKSWSVEESGGGQLFFFFCTSSLWVTGKSSSQRLPWRDDYIMAVLSWVAAEETEDRISRETEGRPRCALAESPHSCNGGLWLVTCHQQWHVIGFSFKFRSKSRNFLCVFFFLWNQYRRGGSGFFTETSGENQINTRLKGNMTIGEQRGSFKHAQAGITMCYLVFGGPILQLWRERGGGKKIASTLVLDIEFWNMP